MKNNGHRFLANHGNIETLEKLANGTEESIGKAIVVRRDAGKEGRNLFVFKSVAKL